MPPEAVSSKPQLAEIREGLGDEAVHAAFEQGLGLLAEGGDRLGLADKGGFDLIAQGFAGLMAVTGEPGRPPVKNGNPVADVNAGILAAAGVAAA